MFFRPVAEYMTLDSTAELWWAQETDPGIRSSARSGQGCAPKLEPSGVRAFFILDKWPSMLLAMVEGR